MPNHSFASDEEQKAWIIGIRGVLKRLSAHGYAEKSETYIDKATETIGSIIAETAKDAYTDGYRKGLSEVFTAIIRNEISVIQEEGSIRLSPRRKSTSFPLSKQKLHPIRTKIRNKRNCLLYMPPNVKFSDLELPVK